MNIVVAESAYHLALFHFENNNSGVGAVRRIFHPEFYIFEKLGIPERLKITAQRLFVVCVVFAAEDAGFQGVVANAAVADEFDPLNYDRSLLWLLGISVWGARIFACNCFTGKQI